MFFYTKSKKKNSHEFFALVDLSSYFHFYTLFANFNSISLIFAEKTTNNCTKNSVHWFVEIKNL